MSTPITEYIAENIESAISAIKTINDFNQDLLARRRKRIDYENQSGPISNDVIILQGEDEVLGEDVGVRTISQKFILSAIVLDSDSSEDSIETKMGQVRDDMRKKLVEDTSRGGYAIDTVIGAAIPFDDGEGFTGIALEIDVIYRTQYADPYTGA